MAVVFLFGPLGLTVGFVIGLIVALRSGRGGFLGFLRAQGLSILWTVALAGVVSGLAWLGADHPPKIGGKNVALEFEVKIPPAISLPADLNDYSVRANLYSSNRDNRFANIDTRSVTRQESCTITGSAVLISRAGNRSLLLSIVAVPGPGQCFVLTNLPPAPSAETDWSDWIAANQYADLKPIP